MPKPFVSRLRREKHAGSWPTGGTQRALCTVAAVLRIDLSVTYVASLTTPVSTSAQAPSAAGQNRTSAQFPEWHVQRMQLSDHHPSDAGKLSPCDEASLSHHNPQTIS